MDDTFTELQAELQSSKFIQEVSQKAVSIDQPSVEDIPVESFAKLIINFDSEVPLGQEASPFESVQTFWCETPRSAIRTVAVEPAKLILARTSFIKLYDVIEKSASESSDSQSSSSESDVLDDVFGDDDSD